MKVTLIMVSTVNGKITKGDNPHIHSWTSKEDKDFFAHVLTSSNLSVMGSRTFEAAKDMITPERERRRIILTSHPQKYAKEVVEGLIDFTNESPDVLVKRLEKEGYDSMLLLGGGETNRAFFEYFVTEIYMTLEPKLFGNGRPLVGQGTFSVDLELLSQKQLNTTGTLLLHYKVRS